MIDTHVTLLWVSVQKSMTLNVVSVIKTCLWWAMIQGFLQWDCGNMSLKTSSNPCLGNTIIIFSSVFRRCRISQCSSSCSWTSSWASSSSGPSSPRAGGALGSVSTFSWMITYLRYILACPFSNYFCLAARSSANLDTSYSYSLMDRTKDEMFRIGK